MQTHVLKIEERFYIEIKAGMKTFEVRLNDRDYKIWDRIEFNILFKNWIEKYKSDIYLIITWVFQEEWYWIAHGVCILSFVKFPLIQQMTGTAVNYINPEIKTELTKEALNEAVEVLKKWAVTLRDWFFEAIKSRQNQTVKSLEELTELMKKNNISEMKIMSNEFLPKNTVMIAYNLE